MCRYREATIRFAAVLGVAFMAGVVAIFGTDPTWRGISVFLEVWVAVALWRPR